MSVKQTKVFNHLYLEEDVGILSAYEVYLMTKDTEDLLHTLHIIEKVSFFRMDLDKNEDLDNVSHEDSRVQK